MNNHSQEIEAGERFEFGFNWTNFLSTLNEKKIDFAEISLKKSLGVNDLIGLRFLDAGSGSGLFSLAARRLGAQVFSFDYDPQSVACTRKLREIFYSNDDQWEVRSGSVLDNDFLGTLNKFDIVYSWGVLHHTGQMYSAINNLLPCIAPNGRFYLALYNDAGMKSHIWWKIKSLYCRYNFLRPLIIVYGLITMRSGWLIHGLLSADVFKRWREYEERTRGMSAWHDLVDWVGGFPYEYARPEEIFNVMKSKGFSLEYLSTMQGDLGCNEFVFQASNTIRESN